MTRLILAAALAAAPIAAFAQDSSSDGSDLMQRGADIFLRGLLDEVQPPLQELAGIGARHLLTLQTLFDEMGPAFTEVFEQIDSITYYQPPEILPNGDIIFRRNADAPAWHPREAAPERSEPAEPEQRSAPERTEPERTEPWMRPPPAAPEDDTLHLDHNGDMEL